MDTNSLKAGEQRIHHLRGFECNVDHLTQGRDTLPNAVGWIWANSSMDQDKKHNALGSTWALVRRTIAAVPVSIISYTREICRYLTVRRLTQITIRYLKVLQITGRSRQSTVLRKPSTESRLAPQNNGCTLISIFVVPVWSKTLKDWCKSKRATPTTRIHWRHRGTIRTHVLDTRILCKNVKKVCNKYKAAGNRSLIKDGWIPEYMAHKAHLSAIIKLRRDVTGDKRVHQWRTVTEAAECIWRIMDYWETQLTELQLNSALTNKRGSITDKKPGFEAWSPTTTYWDWVYSRNQGHKVTNALTAMTENATFMYRPRE